MLLISAVTVYALVVAGCGRSDVVEDVPPVAGTSGEVPGFSGPYAEEFAKSYREATSDFVRSALQDEEISDAEYAEMSERFRQCLAEVGIEFDEFDADGSFMTTNAPHGGDTHAFVTECSESSGENSVGMLWTFIRGNPENRDTYAGMAECLVSTGVVSPGYDAEQYMADAEGRFSNLDNLPEETRTALVDCSQDPFGHLDDQ